MPTGAVVKSTAAGLFRFIFKSTSRHSFLCRSISSDIEDEFTKFEEPAQHTRDHMKRTEHSERHREICPARVISVKNLSPTVKGVLLHLNDSDRQATSFLAGQWVDMFIPGVETVGGFSICNSPRSLEVEGVIELAVKFSDHPPAHWIHTQCEVGSGVDIRVGGNFHYQSTANKDLLLIAGGVGINPLLSIFRHRRDLYLDNPESLSLAKTTLIYSAKTYKELLFQDKIEKISQEIPCSRHYYITKEGNDGTWPHSIPQRTYTNAKISGESLLRTIGSHTKATDSYICGPPAFIDRIEKNLLDVGFLKGNIFYEKWW
ncbi:oxidoreductase NAD-binding domain-containing protein 1-like isoform X1 [Clavelina lepadiformis]|uniref:oxidoreductase NAD-binding domain-containing protein 1-like isoform X1 n=2 Tax=Clavelina lepadiformis TaxID=159417 RepID=UPI0040433CFD